MHADGSEHDTFEDYEEPATYQVELGDTLRYRSGYIVVKEVNRSATIQNIPVAAGDLAVGLLLEVYANNDKTYKAEPIYLIKNGMSYDFEKNVDEQGLKFRFTNIRPDENKLELMVYQKPPAERKWIVMKATEFPYINFFWGGTIIMTIGFILAIVQRAKDAKRVKEKKLA